MKKLLAVFATALFATGAAYATEEKKPEPAKVEAKAEKKDEKKAATKVEERKDDKKTEAAKK